jgi:hypothetical protein
MEQTARPASGRSRRRKTWLIIGAIFVFVLGTAEIVYWTHRRADERRQAEADERAERIIAQAAHTRDYGAAREQIEAGHFDFDTLKRAVRTEIRRQTMIRVNGYFDLKTEQQRRDYLDKVINEATAYQKLAAATPQPAWAPPPKATPRGKGAFISWVAQQPATTRARLAEFGAAFNARLAQRGLPRMDGPFD